MTWQAHDELGIDPGFALDLDRAAMLLGHDVIADRQTKPGSFACRLRREEWLKQLVLDFRLDADAVIANPDFDLVAPMSRRYAQGWPKRGVAVFLCPFMRRIEPVAEQVQEDAGDLLRRQFDRRKCFVEVTLQRDIKLLILGTGTVISKVQSFLD